MYALLGGNSALVKTLIQSVWCDSLIMRFFWETKIRLRRGVGVLRFFRENGVQFGQEKSRKDRTVELRLQLMNLQGRLPIKNRWVHFSTWMLTSRRCSRLLVKGFMWTRMAKKLCLLRDVVNIFSRQDLTNFKTDRLFMGKHPCRFLNCRHNSTVLSLL